DAETARRILDQLGALLAAVATEPERRLSELALLSAGERERVEAWQSGPPLPERVPSFAARFADRVRENPNAVALVHGAQRITYAELDARAGRLASRLRRLGVGMETRVGVCLPRAPELIVALLAIARSGGAAVTQEPHFPAERIASVLRDAGAKLVIATTGSMESVPSPCRVLRLDDPEERAIIDAEPSHDIAVEVDDEALAVVLYTSGSTGKPKGVMLRHGSVAAFLAWMGERFPLAPGDLVLGATSVCFDVHVAEIHHALAGGGTLVLVENAMSLAELPAGTALTQVSMVPTAARELLALGRFPTTARRVLLAGEPVPAELASDLRAAGVGEVHNLYGPTEDTTYSTHASLASDGRVTLGSAIGGGRAYVLDARLRPVPAGVVGEIYLAGRGVARGYLGAPALTAARFVPDPFGPPGERMYASGDRARWLPTGELHLVGRADFQVKVRGFRVEPGEVESVLRRHPAVADAVVAARGEGAARRLVAWVAPAAPGTPDPATLAAWVAAHLPPYMVPSVVVMDAFPRTVSGKVDRAALPEPAAEAREYTPPRTATESALAEVWSEVLGTGRVGAGDDFFALGGHSLGAMHAWSRIREHFRVDLPLRALFENPGLGDLARAIDAARPVEEAAPERVTARARTVRAVLITPKLAEVGDE
ncbi:MAG TPA: non-ribosomal peptide synthetase, partial [Longimicrobium sp.]|nr:non-ribosomal peptide synthetase [Longimicrobium sp.]